MSNFEKYNSILKQSAMFSLRLIFCSLHDDAISKRGFGWTSMSGGEFMTSFMNLLSARCLATAEWWLGTLPKAKVVQCKVVQWLTVTILLSFLVFCRCQRLN